MTVARVSLLSPGYALLQRGAVLSRSQRLVLFATLLGAAGTAVWVGPLQDAHQLTPGASAPWWAFLIACYLCSLFYVQIKVHRTTANLSLTEIPVAMGLILLDPHLLLGCYLAGILLAHWTRHGFRPATDAVNLMLDTMYIAVAVLVFGAVGPDARDPLALRSILAVGGAMAAAGWVVGPLAVNGGIVASEGRVARDAVLRSTLFQIAATATNACLGVIGLVLFLERPILAIALVPPIVLVFVGQLGAGESQRRAERMEFLYRTSDILHSAKQMGDRYSELLGNIVREFGVERAELLLIPDSRGPAVRFASVGGEERLPLTSSSLTYGEQEILNALRDGGALGGREPDRLTPLRIVLEERGMNAGSVALLRGTDRPLGMLLLLNPVDGVGQLTPQESNLLMTVAGQVSVALENGQLADAVRAITAENNELAKRAYQDPLTELANRSLFTDTVNDAVARMARTERPIAVLFIDLDGFKQVNDTHGHASGDELLRVLADRLRQLIRKRDLAARIGGDEFAVLLNGMRLPEDAEIVANRVVAALRAPLLLGHGEVAIGGSVGVAVVDDVNDAPKADELLRRADMAMYLAKRQGKGRYVIFDPGARDPLVVSEMVRVRVG